MKTLMYTLILSAALIIAYTQSTHAAPIPGTATSKLVSPEIGLYHSPAGFQMNAGKTGWAQVAPPAGNKFIATMYRSRTTTATGDMITRDLASGKTVVTGKNVSITKPTASLTVRVDDLDREIAIDKYIQKWMKEYPRYGFDVMGSKPFVQNKQKGYVLDLVNRDQGKQLRQVVFVKQKKGRDSHVPRSSLDLSVVTESLQRNHQKLYLVIRSSGSKTPTAPTAETLFASPRSQETKRSSLSGIFPSGNCPARSLQISNCA